MPQVSIIIPVHNRASFLERAVQSVLGQTFTDFEGILVDDGSSDETPSVIRTLVKRDSRLFGLKHEINRGAQAARNTGVRVSKGDYVAFLDSDDEWLPQKLEKQMVLFSRPSGNIAVVYAGFRMVFSDNRPEIVHFPQDRGNVYKAALSRWVADMDTLVIRKDALERAGFLDESIRAFQEWDLCIRVARHGAFDYVAEPLAVYHIHSKPTISRDLSMNAFGYLDVVQSHKVEILKECGPEALREHYLHTGYRFVLAHRLDLARNYFVLASRVPPFNPKGWLFYGASLLGRGGYLALRSLRHGRPPSEALPGSLRFSGHRGEDGRA